MTDDRALRPIEPPSGTMTIGADPGGHGGERPTASASVEERIEARRFLRPMLIWTGLFSIFVNLLMLTGPLFMLQVYDRVLSSGSMPTLFALFGLVTVLFLFMGVLDLLRGRILSRAGAKIESLFDRRLFRLGLSDRSGAGSASLRHVESVCQGFCSGGMTALFDLPWSPLFLLVIFAFHWSMGALALVAGLVVVSLALINSYVSQEPLTRAQTVRRTAKATEQGFQRHGDVVQALGMGETITERVHALRSRLLDHQMTGHDRSSGFSVTVRTFRLFAQSAMLALGAALAIHQEITAGMMIAASILMGRALAPVDQLVAHWPTLTRARESWRSLQDMLKTSGSEKRDHVSLPRPEGRLTADNLAIAAPETTVPILRGINFALAPGEALGVIGKSASGKSTLAKALVGGWPVIGGEIRLDGATLDQYDPDRLGAWLGYLPQDVVLFEGTVGQNIARFGMVDDDAVLAAAKAADAHDMILRLPAGYDTMIQPGGANLSGGQRQRIALARALHGEPPLLVLDEPNAHLDMAGEQALVAAIHDAKTRGRAAVVIAHRPSAIAACDTLLVLQDGRQADLGPRDDVLERMTRNESPIKQRLRLIGSSR